jgi:hypothetical protein
VGDLVPYDPSYETPDEGGGALTDAQQRTESLRESSPAKYNLLFLNLAQCLPRTGARLRPDRCRTSRALGPLVDPSQLTVAHMRSKLRVQRLLRPDNDNAV